MKSLAHPCKAPTTFGQQTLKAIWDGNLPPNVDRWPVEPLSTPVAVRRATKRCANVQIESRRGKTLNVEGTSFTAATPMHGQLTFSCVPRPATVLTEEQAHAELLQDMQELEAAGEKVVRPTTASSTADAQSTCSQVDLDIETPSDAAALPPPPQCHAPGLHLADLLDLYDFGEPVSWPEGFCPATARAALRVSPYSH